MHAYFKFNVQSLLVATPRNEADEVGSGCGKIENTAERR